MQNRSHHCTTHSSSTLCHLETVYGNGKVSEKGNKTVAESGWEGTGYDNSMCKVPNKEYDTGLQNLKWMDKTVRDLFTLSSTLGMRGHPMKTVGPDSK